MFKHWNLRTFFLLAAAVVPLIGCSANEAVEQDDAGRAMDGGAPRLMTMDARQDRHFALYRQYHAMTEAQPTSGDNADNTEGDDDGQPALRHAILTSNAAALSACSPHLLLVED